MNSCSSGVLMPPPIFFFSTFQSFLNATLCDRDRTFFTLLKGLCKRGQRTFLPVANVALRQREGAKLAGYQGWDGRYPSPRCLICQTF